MVQNDKKWFKIDELVNMVKKYVKWFRIDQHESKWLKINYSDLLLVD